MRIATKPNGLVFGSVYDLNISQSALYLIAGMKRPNRQEPACGHDRGRQGASLDAKQIIADIDKPETELAHLSPGRSRSKLTAPFRLDAPVAPRLYLRTIRSPPAKQTSPIRKR